MEFPDIGHKQEGVGEKIGEWRHYGGCLYLYGPGVRGD